MVPAALAAVLRRPAWHRRAACRGVGPGLFFIEEEDPVAAHAVARSLCRRCPVQVACGDAGIDEAHGIWGGAAAGERLFWQADPAVMERAGLA